MSVKTLLLNFLLSLGLFCVSFYLAWQVSVSTNFLYSFWYEVIDIDTTISTYAPKNKNRQGFEQTNKQEQVRLFSGIVAGIQHQGNGFDELKYSNSNGKVIDALLTEAEVIHLKDVANLVNSFKYLGAIGFLLAVIALTLMLVAKIKHVEFKYHLIGGVGFVLFISTLVLLVGPTKIFYAGHELIFPDDHQWFFYFEDSLMSTMMKAPVLFGPIAAELLVFCIMAWIFLLYGSRFFTTKYFTPLSKKH